MRCGSVLVAWFWLAGLTCLAAEKAVVSAWAEKLSDKFWAGGDRVFVYELTKPGAPVITIQVADCQSKGFGAARLMEGGELQQAIGWFALGGGGEVGHWFMGGRGGTRMEGMGAVIDRLGEMEKVMGGNGIVANGGFNWSLYLTDQELGMAMGVELGEGRRRAPWLKADLLAGATGAAAGEDSVSFEFGGGQSLLVRNDGVLLEQKSAGGRTMTLVKVEEMEEWSALKYFGKFDLRDMKVEKVDGGKFYYLFLRQYVQAVMGHAVEKKTTVEELEKDRGEARKVMTTLLRPLAGTMIERDPELLRMATSMGMLFQKPWGEILKDKPKLGESGGYAEFVKTYQAKIWEMMQGEFERFGEKFQSKMPPLFSGEERSAFKGEEARIAVWVEEVEKEAFTPAMLAEMLDWAVKVELEKEEIRKANLRRQGEK